MSTTTHSIQHRGPSLIRVLRLAASVLVLMTCAYYLVVAFDNITNPASNWVFVEGVTELDGVYANSGFEWRAIDAEWFQVAGYIVLIAGETIAGLTLLIAGILGLVQSGDREGWARAQRWTILGTVVGLAVFFLGFITIGGNWFVMYLNDKWNGLDPAFQNSVMTMLVALFVLGVIIVDQVLDTVRSVGDHVANPNLADASPTPSRARAPR